VLGLDGGGVLDWSRVFPGRQPARGDQARHRSRAPFAYQLAHGVIPRLGWSSTEDAVITHQCDFAGCTNPAHMRLGTNATNRFEYLTRRGNLANPLADVRGAAGRTRAIATAIRASLANHEDAADIERRILDAQSAGIPSPSGDNNKQCRVITVDPGYPTR
jgi:hypothetical protein